MDIVARLRAETAEDHAAVEGSIPLMAPDLTLACYVTVLQRMHGIVAAWESLVQRDAPGWLRPLALARLRLPLLEADLRSCGGWPPPADMPELPAWTPGQLAGPVYVMEGSRLGGQLIAKFVEGQLGFAPGAGDSYFRSSGVAVKPRWDELLGALRANVQETDSGPVVVAARQMFSAFGDWMRGGAAAGQS